MTGVLRGDMKLALSQIISGALITLFALLPVTYGGPIKYSGASYPSLVWYKICIVALGLTMLGVGIAQYIKARKHQDERRPG
jgi:predicted phage tail protein